MIHDDWNIYSPSFLLCIINTIYYLLSRHVCFSTNVISIVFIMVYVNGETWICFVGFISSAECQIKHWRSWHRHECFRRETEEGEARDVHDHQNPMLVENYDNVRFQSCIHKEYSCN
jgi:hypothetical protein